jgi:transposase
MRPYSNDLRLRVVQAYENHEGSMRQLAARFRLSLSGVRDLLTRYRTTGSADVGGPQSRTARECSPKRVVSPTQG